MGRATLLKGAEAAERPAQARAKSSTSGEEKGDGEYDFDLFTLGAGSGGTRASRMSASNHGPPPPPPPTQIISALTHSKYKYHVAQSCVVPTGHLSMQREAVSPVNEGTPID